jgi:microcystin-dependent protein
VFLYSNAPSGTTAMAASAIGATGGGQPHDNMPPYLVLNYIIALQGIFPSRN